MEEMLDAARPETDLDELVQTNLEQLCEQEEQGWNVLVDEINSRLADLNVDEDKTFETLADSQLFAFDTFAETASSGLTTLIEEQSEQATSIIQKKTEDMDALLNALTNQFEEKFWASIESIFESIHYLERQALIWEALKGKDKLIV